MANLFKLILFLLLQHFSYLKVSNIFNIYDKKLMEEYYLEKSINEDLNTNITINEAVSLFPIAYLAFIITQFLPNKTTSNSNVNLREYLIRSNCFKEYEEEYKKNININRNQLFNLFNTIHYSGKAYPDFGFEKGCIDNNNSFILINIIFNITGQKNYTSKYKLLPFISNGFSFYGLCIKNSINCTDNLSKILNEINEQYLNVENSEYPEYQIKTFINNKNDTTQNKKEKDAVTSFLLVLIPVYILMRIIIEL